MKKNIFAVSFLIYIIFLFSCNSQGNFVFNTLPDDDFYADTEKKIIDINSITDTMHGVSHNSIPAWLTAYINGGIEEVERMPEYSNKYVFIESSEGVNFTALAKWAENYSAKYDLTMPVASRIDKRLVSAAVQYPDYEYGSFYETIVKNAYSTEFRGAVKEEVFWIKTRTGQENFFVEPFPGEQPLIMTTPSDVYKFFILFTIEKPVLQESVNYLMVRSINSVNPTNIQRNAIHRMRLFFFMEF